MYICRKMARKSRYDEKLARSIAKDLAEAKGTIYQICAKHKISHETYYRWIKDIPSFNEIIKEAERLRYEIIGESALDGLQKLINGYEYEEVTTESLGGGAKITKVTTKFVPPNPTMVIFSLKNRKASAWKDKTEVDHTTGGKPITPVAFVLKSEALKAKPEEKGDGE